MSTFLNFLKADFEGYLEHVVKWEYNVTPELGRGVRWQLCMREMGYKQKAGENLSFCLHVMAVCKEQIPHAPASATSTRGNISHPLLQLWEGCNRHWILLSSASVGLQMQTVCWASGHFGQARIVQTWFIGKLVFCLPLPPLSGCFKLWDQRALFSM